MVCSKDFSIFSAVAGAFLAFALIGCDTFEMPGMARTDVRDPNPEQVVFSSAVSDALDTTAVIVLTFNRAVSLSVANVGLYEDTSAKVPVSSDIAEITGITNSSTGTTYTHKVAVSSAVRSKTCYIVVSKSGYTFTSTKYRQITLKKAAEAIEVNVLKVEADGSETAAGAKITITLDKNMALTAADLCLYKTREGAAANDSNDRVEGITITAVNPPVFDGSGSPGYKTEVMFNRTPAPVPPLVSSQVYLKLYRAVGSADVYAYTFKEDITPVSLYLEGASEAPDTP